MKIEDHFSSKLESRTPVEIEWAIDGISRELFIVQVRPATIHSAKPVKLLSAG